jgi:hypothetical protein
VGTALFPPCPPKRRHFLLQVDGSYEPVRLGSLLLMKTLVKFASICGGSGDFSITGKSHLLIWFLFLNVIDVEGTATIIYPEDY